MVKQQGKPNIYIYIYIYIFEKINVKLIIFVWIFFFFFFFSFHFENRICLAQHPFGSNGCENRQSLAGWRWESIAIWTDRWLPWPSTFRVLTPPTSHSANTKVSTLINPDSGDWNVHMINQLFLPTDVTSILSIPLSRHKQRDKLV